ncbi:MAG: HAMP domain-containing protein [Rhizobiales bacterium]|nr:HAMP domain-containing protein [Hyphomicrobiales bacterium]
MFRLDIIKRAGIGTQVYGVIGAIVTLTVAASVLASLSFKRVDYTIHSLVDERYPVVEKSLNLAQAATEAVAVAPKLADATTETERAAIMARLGESDKRMRSLIDDLARYGAIDQPDFIAKIDRLNGAIGQANTGALQRIAIESEKAKRAAELTKANDAFNEALVSVVDEAQFNLLIGLETAADGKGADTLKATLKQLSDQELATYGAALTLQAEVNQVFGLLREILVLDRRELLVPASDRFRALSQRATKALQASEKVAANKKRRQVTEAALAFGSGDGGLLKLRERDFENRAVLAKSLAAATEAATGLHGDIDRVVVEARTAAQDARRSTESLILNSSIWLMLIGAASVIAAGAIAFFYVRPYIVARLKRLWTATGAIADGKLDTEVDTRGSDEIAGLARSVQLFRDNVVALRAAEAQAAEQQRATEEERNRNESVRMAAARDVQSIVNALGAALDSLAKGDLTHHLTEDFADEYKKVQDDFNAAIGQLRKTISAIANATRVVAHSAAEISSSTSYISEHTEKQAANLEETTASMREISATVKKNAENAKQANQFANGMREAADRGGDVVANAVKAMARIEDSSRKISDIIGLIDEIAFQTNLLALNAGVEAARAGDAGRGFAVVAAEVRNLAQRSSQAAKDIKDLIINSSGQVEEGVKLVNRAGTSLSEIVDAIKRVAEIVSQIAVASAEQSSGLDQINIALAQMDKITKESSTLAEQTAAAAQALEHQSHEMAERVSLFELDEREAETEQTAAESFDEDTTYEQQRRAGAA